jgi:hypothetical protein
LNRSQAKQKTSLYDEQAAYLLYSLYDPFWGAGVAYYELGEAARK